MFYIISIAALGIVFIFSILWTRSEETCALCHFVPIEGVVLVDTRTGDSEYIEVWQPHDIYVGQVAPWEEQQNSGGYVKLSNFGAGMSKGYSPAIGQYVYSFAPVEIAEQGYLCDEHIVYRNEPYVLVDTNSDALQFYAVKQGKKYQIRDNLISIGKTGDQLSINIISQLFDENMRESD